MRYLVVVEPTPTGFSARSPDLVDCFATGASRTACKSDMREAIELHLDGLRAEGWPVPEPTTSAAFVEVA